MPPTIPPLLVPCLQNCITSPQTLITSVIDASAKWLALRITYACIHGVDYDRAGGKSGKDSDGDANVVFVSFVSPIQLWSEQGKRIGIDFANLVAAKRLAYIDGLTCEIDSPRYEGNKPTTLRSHSLQDLSRAVRTAKQTLLTANESGTNRNVIVLDGLDFILASQPDISQVQLSQFVLSLQEEFSSVIVCAAADAPLIHNIEPSATALEIDHSNFIRVAAHQSSIIIQIRPLETGTAKDVSGVICISHNRVDADNVIDADRTDGEWLYQVKNDGSVRVWSRGA